MLEISERLLSRLKEVWDAMTLNQKVVSGGVLVAFLVAVSYLFSLRENFINYTVLFSELDSKSASEISTRLEQQNVPYRISSDGSIIEVPRNRATKLKINLAAEGLPETGIMGFEILDTTTFGMSERIQEVKIQQALQGELSRTLMSLDNVEWASVNLSIPPQSLFTEMEKPTTAAVILKFRGGRSLTPKQIDGLTNLISSAVPGLESQNVTILDTRGNSLTKVQRDETAMLSSTQWECKMQIDSYLANEAKRMLDGAFGNGKSLVTVNTELDWDRLERSTTSYDQEKSAIRSEDRSTLTNPTPDGTGEEEYGTVNYETGQIIENFVKNPGDISRMTVSVFIDKRDSTWTDDDDVEQITKVPWTNEQLASIRQITENAVGYNPERGDRLEVKEAEFGGAVMTVAEAGFLSGINVTEIIRTGFAGIAVVVSIALFFFVIKTVIATLDPSKMAIKADEEFKKYGATIEEEEVVESEKDVLVRKIVKASIENSEIAAKTLRTFFKED